MTKVEKWFFANASGEKNSDARRILQRKSNHMDDPAEVLRAEFWLGALKHRERRARVCTTISQNYWNTVIKERRAARKCISYELQSDSVSQRIDEETANPCTQDDMPAQNTNRKRKSTANKQASKRRKIK